MKSIVKNKKGFTLAELLIVVAIIGVLVAVSIPIFTAQLKKARLATNQANARAAYAAAVAKRLDNKETVSKSYDYTVSTAVVGSPKDAETDKGISLTQKPIANWEETEKVGDVELGTDVGKTWTITFSVEGDNETVFVKGTN